MDEYGLAIERPDLVKYLTFMLGTQRFALPIGDVREVIRFSAVTAVPLMPDFLRGVINVRGTVLPLMDLALRMGLEATGFGRRTCVVILELHEDEQTASVGALVDAVHAVLELDPSGFVAPKAVEQRIPDEFMRGMAEHDGTQLIVLEPASLFAPGDLQELLGRSGFGRNSSTVPLRNAM